MHGQRLEHQARCDTPSEIDAYLRRHPSIDLLRVHRHFHSYRPNAQELSSRRSNHSDHKEGFCHKDCQVHDKKLRIRLSSALQLSKVPASHVPALARHLKLLLQLLIQKWLQELPRVIESPKLRSRLGLLDSRLKSPRQLQHSYGPYVWVPYSGHLHPSLCAKVSLRSVHNLLPRDSCEFQEVEARHAERFFALC